MDTPAETTAEILIVEDEPAHAEAIQEGLSRLGHRCTVTPDGQQAIDELNRRNSRGGQSNHYPKIPFSDLFYCTHSEARAKMAIPGCRGSAISQISLEYLV